MTGRSFHRWLFALAVPFTLWLTWAAWRGPPPQASTTTPEPISRSASPSEIAAVHATANSLTKHIQAAQNAKGRDIHIGELEGKDEQGNPFIPIPIPDNPLVAGVASIQEACGTAIIANDKDWSYCPTTGELHAVIPNYSAAKGNP
jgi:hypothetical protein